MIRDIIGVLWFIFSIFLFVGAIMSKNSQILIASAGFGIASMLALSEK